MTERKLYVEMSETEYLEYKRNSTPLTNRSAEELALALFDVLQRAGASVINGTEGYSSLRKLTKARLTTDSGYDIDLTIVRPREKTDLA